ncbi:DUF397 domain-containing protein [Streptomyces sp. HU2014]|uniref:DUF397 domain-containing protein n=1 Tax=Streptomyces sp. HU2014 TaxID=2939414 RepID=UPI00200D7D71|nr:DUF397 domain-containing protein [Streptomyces sp. HU2014]UQI48800.1 DUF397 domain-containing protein [Streptomyces sp. HU2014]
MSTTSPDLSGVEWLKSSHSGNGGGSCVEWPPSLEIAGVIPVRDSKRPQGPVLTVPTAAWPAFTGAIRGGGLPAG